MGAEYTKVSMSQEFRVYSKFRPPDLMDVATAAAAGADRCFGRVL